MAVHTEPPETDINDTRGDSSTPGSGRACVGRWPYGVVVEVRVTAPSMIGKVVRYTVRKHKVPSVKSLCLPPWASKPTAR